LNTYELAVLYHPDLEIDLEKASQKVIKLITDNKGKLIGEDNWGKRKLAYKIKGLASAVYVFYTVELPPQAVGKVEASLNITDEVIRFLITKPDLKAIARAEAVKSSKEAKKQKSKAEKVEKPTESPKEEAQAPAKKTKETTKTEATKKTGTRESNKVKKVKE
jgi:small subunit ribosomal protein S6